MRVSKKIGITVAALAAVFTMTSCTSVDTSSTQKALQFGGGLKEDREFKNCYKPSSAEFNGYGDSHYVYQVDLRSFDATGREGAETAPIEVISKEGERVTVPITIAFYLNPDCKSLLDFHNTIGDKYVAYNENGKPGKGWRNLLNFAVGGPLNVTLDRISSSRGWEELYTDETLRAKLEAEVAAQIPSLIAQKTGGKQFFQDFAVTMEKPDLVNQALKDSISARQTSIQQGLAAEAKAIADGKAATAAADAQRLTAEANAAARLAEVKVEQANAAKQRAIIAGFGSVKAYLEWLALTNKLNPYQPTYILPAGQPTP